MHYPLSRYSNSTELSTKQKQIQHLPFPLTLIFLGGKWKQTKANHCDHENIWHQKQETAPHGLHGKQNLTSISIIRICFHAVLIKRASARRINMLVSRDKFNYFTFFIAFIWPRNSTSCVPLAGLGWLIAAGSKWLQISKIPQEWAERRENKSNLWESAHSVLAITACNSTLGTDKSPAAQIQGRMNWEKRWVWVGNGN